MFEIQGHFLKLLLTEYEAKVGITVKTGRTFTQNNDTQSNKLQGQVFGTAVKILLGTPPSPVSVPGYKGLTPLSFPASYCTLGYTCTWVSATHVGDLDLNTSC